MPLLANLSRECPEGGSRLLTGAPIAHSPFHRQGSLLLSERLALDPFGSLYRGVALQGDRYAHHLLVRLFSGEFLRAARIGNRIQFAVREVLNLGYERALGVRFILEDDPAPLLACDHVPGRSLAQVIKHLGHGLPQNLALAVLGRVARGVHRMHVARLPHGTLTPHCVWLGFQGQVRVLDAPIARVLSDSLARTPDAKAALAPFLQPGETDPIRLDLFQLGVLFHVLLTGRPLPDPRHPEVACLQAQAHSADGPTGLHPALHHLLARLLGAELPFPNLEGLVLALDDLLLAPEAPAHTFELAAWMQRRFRDPWRREQVNLQVEKDWDFRWLLAQESRKAAEHGPAAEAGVQAPAAPKRFSLVRSPS